MSNKLTTIEFYVIEAVKRRRLELDINPSKLSLEIGLDRSFVGKVEKLELGGKYSFNHLNEIAKVLKCKVSDFLPDPYVEADCIEEYKETHPERRAKY